MDAVSRRLLKELQDLQRDRASSAATSELEELAPMDDADLLSWKATMRGPEGSPYEGGRFHLTIQVPSNYPLQPPKIEFVTRVCHPNVRFATGEICLDILKTAWSPAWTLRSTCLAIALLLNHPEPSSPLNVDAANLLRCGDQLGYESLVRMYTRIYAMQ
ncbi:ubiquitin-conjugating enzyme/RWD-like protein [Thamnocephalis sphaerospora]|uniref:Ubiquitin-conjugating enzyme/RWD-like protein n=1 Tax=Thamnocephalis sphaerospora TaxID=78915 RepID=A0A4P9XTX1_9FUNG|nr:ubiquitin-conjugating enzyme/RWD-like protein [Thamnocephalis sphaerospora]|eukprot:RKP09616.1 ubiquitin-conjugating enzyme/RWD-like protein [Thamnocephalis sphaerospora]